MSDDQESSLNNDVTDGGRDGLQLPNISLGNERTVGAGLSGQDTLIDGIKIVDLEARYLVEGQLGQGGMGEVYLATDKWLDRKVAIKRILGEAAGNRMAVNRFLTEAKSIAALNHPNIVQIYDYGRAKDGPFLIMEYVDGGSLLDRCRDQAIPLVDAVDLACQLCGGLAKAHDLGIIHRDIKPANILITKEGIPKLTDFGLAKAHAAGHGYTVTGTGAVMGTPDFMPPEQQQSASLVDHRSDLWSLAATVYQMATGRSPKVIKLRGLPEAIQDVLGKALEEEKARRYQSAHEFRDALKASLSSTATGAVAVEAGQCPACRASNETSRKFCRRCGGTLGAPCLSCSKPMPIWEEICGECGAKQSALVEAGRAEMVALQAKAEDLLGAFEFDRVEEVVRLLTGEKHPRLSFMNAWTEEFRARVEQAQSRHVAWTAETVRQALAHEASYDYASAASALESVPPRLHRLTFADCHDTVGSVLERVQRKRAECLRLEALVQEHLSQSMLIGLEQEIDQLLSLQPHRNDLALLRRHLSDRRFAIDKATALLAHDFDYPAAIASLESLPESTRDAETEKLLSECVLLQSEEETLIDHIRLCVTRDELDGLLPSVKRLFDIHAYDEEFASLRSMLVNRRCERLRRAREAVSAGDLTTACRAVVGARMEDFTGADGELVARILRYEDCADSVTAALRCERTGDHSGVVRILEALPERSHALVLPDGNATLGAMLARSRGRVRTALARTARHDACRQEVAKLRAVKEARTNLVIEACEAAGLTADVARCRIGTTRGPMVLRIHRSWCPRWALWFAQAVKSRSFEAAMVLTARHHHTRGLRITPDNPSEAMTEPVTSLVTNRVGLIRKTAWPVAIESRHGLEQTPSVVFNAPADAWQSVIGYVDCVESGPRLLESLSDDSSKFVVKQLRAVVKSVTFGAPPECWDLISKVDQGIDFTNRSFLEGESFLNEAAMAFRCGLAQDPQDVRAWVGLADCLRRQGGISESVELMEAAVEALPYHSIVLYKLACFHAVAGDTPSAIDYLRRAILMRPEWQEKAQKDADLRGLRGTKNFVSLMNDKGSIRRSQRDVAHGLALVERGRFHEAEAALSVLLKREPEQLDACLALGRCLKLLGRPGDAAEVIERGLLVSPRHPRLFYNLACYHSLAGDTTKALRALIRSLSNRNGMGGEYRTMSKTDGDLDRIRSDPRFDEICA